MNMKKITIIFASLFLLIALASALVTETNNGFSGTLDNDGVLVKTTNEVTDFNAIGFVCANDDCSIVNGTLWDGQVQNSGNDNQMILTYPEFLQQKGYGVFFYKEGFFPFEAKVDYYGNWQAPSANNYFTRKQNCEVPINHLIISHTGNNITVNVTLNAGVSSPVSMAGPLNYVPDSISHLYAVDSKVDFRFIGPENVTLTQNVNLLASTSKEVFVTVNDLAAGEYRIEVESNAIDIKCINSVSNLLNSNIFIAGDRVNETLPLIGILSPEAKTYTNKTILINLRTVNASSVWFNYGDANVTYLGRPVYLDFADGTYTLTAYAKNNLTTAYTSVTFKVNTTIVNNTNQTNQTDLTPPSSISNLNLVAQSKNSLSWNWTNPSDLDFSENIIYINGLNVINSSTNTYSASSLNSNTYYNITVYTKDFSGNVNNYAVSLISKTLSDSTPNGNTASGSSKKKGIRVINDTQDEVSSQIIPVYNQETLDEEATTDSKKKLDYNFILIILTLLTFLLLLIILTILYIKKY